jgi:hypothetical protein
LPKQKNPASRRDFPYWRLIRPGYWLTIALTGVALPVGILLLLTGLLSAALLLLAGHSDPGSDSTVPGCSGSDWTFFNLLAEPFSPPITPNRNVGFGSAMMIARHFKGATMAEEPVRCGAKIAEKITMYSSL